MKINRKISGFLTLALLFTTTFAFIAPANAEGKGWRYWAYYKAAPGEKTWTAAMTGPTVDVKDGAVEGWSFVFDASDIPTVAPSKIPDLATICRRVKADKDLKLSISSYSVTSKGTKNPDHEVIYPPSFSFGY
jgi:hypothetical protein